jgi:hypothetical protein
MRYLTFVLGAGASKAYGFPLGYELVDEVLEILAEEIAEVGQNKNSQHYTRLEYLRDRILIFDPDSIDAFIKRHYTKEPDTNIKHYISKAILRNFNHSFFGKSNKQNWMKYVFEEIYLFLQQHPAADDIPIKIITFNYDTSLEYYFHRQITFAEFLSKKEKDRYRQLFAKSVLHVYGQLGNYSWQTDWLSSLKIDNVKTNWLDNIFHNGSDVNFADHSHYFYNRISTIGDSNNQVIASKAREWLANSNTILISGYSFSPENNSVIGLYDAIRSASRIIVGLHKYTQKQWDGVNAMVRSNPMHNIIDGTTYDILSSYVTLSSEYKLP